MNKSEVKNKILATISNILKQNNYKNNITSIYIYGNTGIGKTTFINDILDDEKFNIIKFDIENNINKNSIQILNSTNLCNKSVMSFFKATHKKQNIIVLDDFENMCDNDKNLINILIKLIRPKKTKKQKLEDYLSVPIIIINNNYTDKKIIEIKKYSYNFKLNSPTEAELKNVIQSNLPNISNINCINMIKNSNYNYNQLLLLINLYKYDQKIYTHILKNRYHNKNTEVIKELYNNNFELSEFYEKICESDRTTYCLIYHENIYNKLITDNKTKIEIYSKILENFCYCDYIDRFMFQRQLWELGEYSSLIKLFYNNYIIHNYELPDYEKTIRFTKILTKYSSEYNNLMFVIKLCNLLNCTLNQLNYNINNSIEKNNIIQKDYDRYCKYYLFASDTSS